MTILKQVLAALATFPDGATALQIATVIDAPLTTVGSQLCRATWADKVVRTTVPRPEGSGAPRYVYRLPTPREQQPMRPVWRGEARMAERV